MLEWDQPTGQNPEDIIDNYTISVTPKPLSHPVNVVAIIPPWFLTLNYNVMYNATITAANCAGKSAPYELNNIEYYNSK